MEIALPSQVVLLSVHRTYKDMDEENCLQAVVEFEPFQAYLRQLADEPSAAPRAFVIRHIQRVAQRVVSVIADVEYVDASGTKTTQVVRWTDEKPAVLLPVVIAQGRSYGVLSMRRLNGTSEPLNSAAFSGTLHTDGSFHFDYAADLSKLGFDLRAIRPVNSHAYTVGDEPTTPVSVLTVSTTVPDIQAIHSLIDDVHKSPGSHDAAHSLDADNKDAPITVLPLEKVAELGDMCTSLAASLLLASA